jgi:hypothetical protein
MNLTLAYKLLLSSILSYGIHSSDQGINKLKLDPILMPSENVKFEYLKGAELIPETVWFCQSQNNSQIDAFMYAETKDEVILAFRGTALPAKFELKIKDLWPEKLSKPTVVFNTEKFIKQISFSVEDSIRVVYDWSNDFKAKAIEDSEFGLPGKIHEGFYKSIRNLWNEKSCKKNLKDVFGDLKKLHIKPKKIYFTGHSKGGALAHLAASIFAKMDKNAKPNAIYTFGAPRFSTIEFVDFYNKHYLNKSWRFEYRDDLVPHVPLDVPLIETKTSELLDKFNISVFKNLGLHDTYVSVGHLIYIEDVNQKHKIQNPNLPELRMKRLHDTILKGRLLNLIFDHAPLWGASYHGYLFNNNR